MAAPVYTVTYTDGAVNLGTGGTFAANGLIVMREQSQAINAGLDVSTNAIDLMHVLGGAPRIVSSAGGTATIKFDNTYTTHPNLVWRAGGYAKWTFDTNACPEMLVDGGQHVIVAGTVTVLVVVSGRVTIEAGATVGTLVLMGGSVTALAAIATVQQSGGRLDAEARIGATKYTLSGGDGYIENTSGSDMASLMLEKAGRFYPLAGDVVAVERRGGVIDYDAATTSVELGSTSFVNYGGDSPASTGNVTISNLTDYAAFANTGGQGVPI